MIAIDPLRRAIVGEMHLRPSPAIDPPARIIQLLALHGPDDLVHVLDFAVRMGIDLGPDAGRRDGSVERSGVVYLWERHAEASTLTLLIPNGLDTTREAEAIERAAQLPGRVLRAIKIDVTADDRLAASLFEELGLGRAETVGGQTGPLKFWSDFKLDDTSGFGRLLVQVDRSDARMVGRLIQQLQELGNYRNLALVGLPTVRQHEPQLAELEIALGRIVKHLGTAGDDQAILNELVQIASTVAQMRSETAYRLSATAAYGRIVGERLASLDPRPLTGFQTLAEFTNRRLMPALRTCENFTVRLDRLATHIEHATGLLRARIETRLHLQNGELLKSLSETATNQLQLQHLVEGLSVFAVSYYAIGLLAYAFEAVPRDMLANPTFAIGASVLPVFLIAALWLRAQRKAHSPNIGNPG